LSHSVISSFATIAICLHMFQPHWQTRSTSPSMSYIFTTALFFSGSYASGAGCQAMGARPWSGYSHCTDLHGVASCHASPQLVLSSTPKHAPSSLVVTSTIFPVGGRSLSSRIGFQLLRILYSVTTRAMSQYIVFCSTAGIG